ESQHHCPSLGLGEKLQPGDVTGRGIVVFFSSSDVLEFSRRDPAVMLRGTVEDPEAHCHDDTEHTEDDEHCSPTEAHNEEGEDRRSDGGSPFASRVVDADCSSALSGWEPLGDYLR